MLFTKVVQSSSQSNTIFIDIPVMKIIPLRNPATFVNFIPFLTRGYAKHKNELLRLAHSLAHYDVSNRNVIVVSSVTSQYHRSIIAVSSVDYHIF